MYVVLVTGDRDWRDRRVVWKVLDGRAAAHGRLFVVDGGAPGADWCARTWRLAHENHRGKTFEADWDRYGRAAGPRRNREMGAWVVQVHRRGGLVEVIAFHDSIEDSHGTADMLDVAKQLGLPRKLVRHKEKVDG